MTKLPHQGRKDSTTHTRHRTTKESIIDAARQLFAHVGIEKTTMNDIAAKSHKGRRTLYVYFRNKKELFAAVVERELELLSVRLEMVANGNEPPNERLINLIYTHLDTILQIVMRNGTLRADFFNDIARLERIHYRFDRREEELIKHILSEGNEMGIFCIRDAEIASVILQHSLKGLEVPYINRQTRRVGSKEFDRMRLTTEQLLFRGLGYRGASSHNNQSNNLESNETIGR